METGDGVEGTDGVDRAVALVLAAVADVAGRGSDGSVEWPPDPGRVRCGDHAAPVVSKSTGLR